jgi:hypothetical protein
MPATPTGGPWGQGQANPWSGQGQGLYLLGKCGCTQGGSYLAVERSGKFLTTPSATYWAEEYRGATYYTQTFDYATPCYGGAFYQWPIYTGEGAQRASTSPHDDYSTYAPHSYCSAYTPHDCHSAYAWAAPQGYYSGYDWASHGATWSYPSAGRSAYGGEMAAKRGGAPDAVHGHCGSARGAMPASFDDPAYDTLAEEHVLRQHGVADMTAYLKDSPEVRGLFPISPLEGPFGGGPTNLVVPCMQCVQSTIYNHAW